MKNRTVYFVRTFLFLALLPMVSPYVADAQDGKIVIQGKVIDNENNPLAGVSIIVENTTIGVASDENGEFLISVPDAGVKLQFSYVGMKTKIVELQKGVLRYSVELAPDSELEAVEVVATGYFNRDKNNFTGSAVTVSGEELKRVNPNNLLRGLEAFDPSFKVAVDNLLGSDPNRLPQVNVRGAASLPTGSGEVLRRENISSSVNMPTFILDGYEVGVEKIYDLDINRVESVSLLKDAAATAIYGSRASNGVMVITTKSPSEGRLRLSYNGELSANLPDLSSYDVLSAAEKLEYERLAGVYETEGISLQQQQEVYYAKLYNVVSGVNTDWLAQPVRNAFGNKHSLYVEGGSPSIRYGVTGVYQNMPGVMKKSGRTRLGLGSDLSYNANKRLLFRNSLSFASVQGADSPYGGFAQYVRMNPYYPKGDSRGNIIREIDSWTDRTGAGGDVNTSVVLNPLYDAMLSSFSTSKYREINDVFSVEWNIGNGLRLRGTASFLHIASNGDSFVSPYSNEFYLTTFDKLSERGRYSFASSENVYVDGNTTLTYNKAIGAHFLNLALGANLRSAESRSKSFTAIGFTNDRFTDVGYAKGYAEGASPASSIDRERLFGSFLSANYSYRNRYLLDLSARLDGSSKFGSNNKVAPFWAAGIGWNMHNEDFIRNAKFITLLRVKANTGITGSVSFSPYMANTLYQYYKNNWYSTGVGAGLTQYGNEDLKWQRTQNYDIGADIGLWDDRIALTFRYYYKHTRDMLADITLPPSTGFGFYRDNLGDIENKGVEVGLKYIVYRNKDWNVSVNGNFVHDQNQLLKISNALKQMNERVDSEQQSEANMGAPLLRYNEGQSLNTIYAVRSKGIDPENGREIFIKKNGTLTYDWDVRDIVPICDATPKLYGFFGTGLSFRKFFLNLSFYTTFGGYEYNQTLVDKIENADPRFNLDRRALENRWIKAGDKALYKDIKNRGTTYVTERFIQKNNLLQLNSVYFAYEFEPKLIRAIGMQMLRAAVTVNDVWRTSSIAIERGINYPFARTLTFSIQTSF